MTNEVDPKASRSAMVLRHMRSVARWKQSKLAKALKMSPKAYSEMERHQRKRPLLREFLLGVARILELPSTFVDDSFAFLNASLRRSNLGASGAADLVGPTHRAVSRFGTLIEDVILEIKREVLAVEGRATADSLWSYFKKLSPEQRSQVVRDEKLFQRWSFVERLWNESLNAAADDHKRALAIAELSLAAAERLEGDARFGSRLQGLAWSAIANAKRVGNDLHAAGEASARAKALWNAGAPGDSGILDEARFHALEAALRGSQRRFSEALACMQLAKAKARPEARPEFLIGEANLLLQLQRQEEASQLYLEAIIQSLPETPPRFVWVARFNFVACVCDLDRPAQAEPHLPELRATAKLMGNGLDLLRVRWLEGRAAGALGRIEEAADILGEAREGFLARGLAFDAALAGLERAALLLEARRTAEVRDDAPELAVTFRNLGVAPELLASLTLFCTAAETERATSEEARQVLSLLRQAGSRQA